MRINNWSGGLFTRRDATLIPTNTGVIYNNINPESEVLKSEYDTSPANISTNGRWCIEGYGNIVSSGVATSFVKYKESVLYTDNAGNLIADKGGRISKVGVEPPTNKPSVNTVTIPSDTPNIIDNSENVGSASPYSLTTLSIPETMEGKYRYVYTYYDSRVGAESVPSPMSDEIQLEPLESTLIGGVVSGIVGDIRAIQITVTTPTQNNIDKIRIYRAGGNLTSFSLVTEIGANQQYIYDISTDFSVAGSHVLDSYSNYVPPKNLKYLTLHNAIIFGAIEDKIYFSSVGDFNGWDIYNTIDFDDTVTGLGSTAHGLLVFTMYKTYIITGTSPHTLAKHILNNEQGCVNHYTIVNLDNSLMWLSTDGICTSNGGAISVITLPYMGKFNPTSINAAAHDRMYVLSCEDKVYIVDLRYSPCIRTLDPIGSPVWVYRDEFVYTDRATGAVNYLFKPSGALRVLSFKSGVIGFDGVTGYKTIKDVYISYIGDFTLTVYAYIERSKVTVLTASLSSAVRKVENLKTRGTYIAYAIEYVVEGRGTIYEIDIKGVTRNAD